jgi:hypothetical protein
LHVEELLWFALLVKYYWNDQIKGDEVNGVVASMGRRDRHRMVSGVEI